MNLQEAKRILAAYRANSSDAEDSEVAEALEHVRRDPALKSWIDQHSVFQARIRASFRGIPIPQDLAARVLSRCQGATRVVWWERPIAWAVAAGVVLLITLSLYSLRVRPDDSLASFRARMIRAPLREYRMDIVTNDMVQIRQFLAANRAPSDYELSGNLDKLRPIGAGLLSWQGQRVAMVCLESSDKNPAFLFVVDQSALTRPPPSKPEFVQVSKLMTASWTIGGKAYVLAAPGDVAIVKKLLNP